MENNYCTPSQFCYKDCFIPESTIYYCEDCIKKCALIPVDLQKVNLSQSPKQVSKDELCAHCMKLLANYPQTEEK